MGNKALNKKIKHVREMLFYSGRIAKEDIKKVIIHLTKPKLPFLGFLDFSGIFSKTPTFIITRVGNTFKFYLKANSKLRHISHLIFPFRFGKELEIGVIKGKLFPPPGFKILFDDVIDVMIKDDVKRISMSIFRFLGIMIGIGKAVRSNGSQFFFISLDPTRFLAVDMEKHPSIYIDVLEPLPKVMSTESEEPIFQDEDLSIGLDNFEPIQHTLVVGESGSGKSVFLRMYLKALQKKYDGKIRIVVIDPHGEFKKKYPGEKKVVDFKESYIEPLAIEGEYSPMLTQLVTQLIVNAIGSKNTYAERVLFHAVHLLASIGELNLKNISRLLSDESKRMEFLSKTEVDEVKHFFDVEFNDIYIHHFNDAILPIINFVSEYELYLGKTKNRLSLDELIKENEMLVISFDPNFFGKRMIKFFGGAIINQMYILAITGKFNLPTILVIDEFPRVENRAIKDILAETRKFNLFTILAAQYLGQLDEEITNAIVGNVRNIVAFKLHKNDAELLAGMMEIKVEEYFKKIISIGELEEKKKEMFVRLDQRECIVRLFDGKKYLLPIKVKTVDATKWLGEAGI